MAFSEVERREPVRHGNLLGGFSGRRGSAIDDDAVSPHLRRQSERKQRGSLRSTLPKNRACQSRNSTDLLASPSLELRKANLSLGRKSED